jgi:autotransporter translocation and assembly factor TamB
VTRLRRLRSVSATLAKVLIGLIAFVLVLLGLGLAAIETGWAKNRIRGLIVRQANQYLTATLSIGRLEGSLLRGITLGDVSVARDGRTLIHIDEIAFSYSIRELVQSGVVVRRVQLTRPRIAAGRQPDGRWDLAALVRRDSREQERTGPSRPIEVLSIEIIDGRISLRDPLDFGAAHVPTAFEGLNASFGFAYFPVRWKLNFDRVSWVGRAPDLSVTRLAGVFGRGPGGWFFENFSVDTARSAFVLDGRINTERKPTELALRVRAARFAFQEWAGVLRGLKNIAVESSFDTALSGPVNQLLTNLRFAGTGGAVNGTFTLDTSVPGWHGAGAVDVDRLNLARWLNRADRPSDITGHVTFDLALELGRHFPRGVYTFEGRHAMYMGYEADQVRARGQLTATNVLVAAADAIAYGAHVSTADSSIAIDSPFPFRFKGAVNGIDLRRVPVTVPVPRVESALTFNYDVSGRFSDPFIVGNATFARSQFLGAAVGGGTVGSIDTSQRPIRYTGDGDVEGINLRRFGEGLEVGWLQEPRYAGTVSGHFQVQGAGTDRATLTLTGGGRLARAEMFSGTLSDADVSIGIDRGTLRASFDGQFAAIDPAIPFANPQLTSSLTGSGRVSATVRDLLTRTIDLQDYDVRGALALGPSMIREVAVESAALDASLADSTLTVTRVQTTGASVQGRGTGTIVFGEKASTDFQYEIARLDLAQVRALTGTDASGTVSTTGRVSGRAVALHAVGDATVNQLAAYGVQALTIVGHYDTVVATSDLGRSKAQISGRGTFITLFGQSVQEASGTVALDADRLGFDLQLLQQEPRNGRLAGTVRLREDRHAAELVDLTVTLGRAPWHLTPRAQTAVVSWNDEGVSVTPVEFADGNNDERIGVSGTWRRDGEGALRITASHVFLDTLQSAFSRPTRYGGVLDLDATLRGTPERPRIAATLTISNGRVERVSYQKLQGRVDYDAQMLRVDLRLDQTAGVWLTAVGSVPAGLFNRDLPDQPLDVIIKSSAINLGLVEGVTDVIRNVSGELKLDMRAIGTGHDPHLDGSVAITNAAFLVTASGATYKNGRATVKLALERMTVETLHIEDNGGRALDVHGSLATHELRVGDLEIEARAQHFEVMRNELGQVDVDATLQVRGQFESPRIAGNVTINSGNLKIDEILQRTLFQPYSTEPTPISDVDAVAALNPWQRLGLDIELHVPNTLRLTGRDVQVSPGTPIGLGDINLRVAGDLYLYKDPAQPPSVTGSFDSVSGTYTFQGRRFDVVEKSSINFRGDLNPEIYVTVRRLISGVETRVGIIGPMRQPELRLSSTPPLDDSDILSLIVFNSGANQLSSAQQQELLVRAGTLAAGFIATPILRAIENQLGLEILDIETQGDFGIGPKVTIGQEIAPGLIARFSRQFGQDPYDEATIEYYLSRILRLRATFSDAQTLSLRSPFRRIERAGIDLLLFFSF